MMMPMHTLTNSCLTAFFSAVRSDDGSFRLTPRPAVCALLSFTFFIVAGGAQTSELRLRGHAVIPSPRETRLQTGDVVVDSRWRLDPGSLPASHIVVRSLIDDLDSFHHLRIEAGAGSPAIRLSVAPGAVKTGAEPAIDRQAYRLTARDGGIEIAANSEQGLFYGVQTLVQLLKRDPAGRLVVPRGVIQDWPALALRFLHWDTKHHQNRMETLKRYIDWAARFKANRIGFELEDKFAYPSLPEVGAPGALTTAALQQIVDYGLERFIQVVPQIQSPAHLAYVLKHPRYSHLRADGNNYQSAMCDPRTYELIFSMYDEVIRATKGVDSVFVSTDEVYYAGIEKGCDKPYNEENRSLRWIDFVRRAHDHLEKQGRTMLIWAEYPLLPQHAKLLPAGIIDGVIGEEGYLAAEKELGIRQLSYNSMQGAELLFPSHFAHETAAGVASGHLEQAYENIAHGRATRGQPIGVYGAAWDDSGLHDETFWLGWSAVARWGWNPGAPRPEQHAAEFMEIYYGPRAYGMIDVYRMLERQARDWEGAWERAVSKARGPGYGNSYGKGVGTTRYDLTLTPPAPRQGDSGFRERYRRMLEPLSQRALENDRLMHALAAAFGQADRNTYNLEVLLSITRFIGHHWRLLDALSTAEKRLEEASRNKPERAVGLMVAAHNSVASAQREGARTFSELKAVYEKSRLPKQVALHVFDDTKDHWADRRPDLSFMTAPEESIGLDHWLKDLAADIQAYAKQHNVPVKGLGEVRLEE